MWSKPTKAELGKVPKLYSQDGEHTSDKLVYLHFFVGACDWYVIEHDPENFIFFGFAILGDPQSAEWGYISYNELKEIKTPFEVDTDKHWEVKKVKDIPKIVAANGSW